MIQALSPHHLKRYKDIAMLLLKYGRSDLVQKMGLHETLAKENLPSAGEEGKPEELAAELERMGPAYIKLGQILSSRADLLPEPYLKALSRLQDNVKPFSYAEVEETVRTELGARISKAFSLSLIHILTLPTNREV
jgi:ubiquinone biosynthesis protein